MATMVSIPADRAQRAAPSRATFRAHPRRHVVVCHAHSHPKHSLFVFGLGYTGLAAANYFQKLGWTVAGTCRTEEKQDTLRARGFQAFAYDANGYEQLDREALAAFQRSSHVLTTVPPDGDSDPVLQAHARHLAQPAEGLQWVGYISSTSVYGDHRGDWVDEESELLAAHGKGLSRLMTESAWLQLQAEHATPVHIFRCGGIYGPRRSALEAARAEGAPSLTQARRAAQRFTSRCHVLDICKVLEASAARPRPGAVYNVVDDQPAGREEVIGFASSLLARQMAILTQEAATTPRMYHGSGGKGRGTALDSYCSGDEDAVGAAAAREGVAAAAEMPGQWGGDGGVPAATATAAAPAQDQSAADAGYSGSTDSDSGNGSTAEAALRGEKRVQNERIKRELKIELAFPTYKEGLQALAAGDMRPFN